MTADRQSTRRPKDWQPLTGSDPTPGDPEAIRDEVRHLKGIAEKLRAQARDLRTVARGEGLKGKYANDLKEKAGDLETRLRQVASRYEEVQGPLRGWAGELEDCQEESIRLLHKAQEKEHEKKAKGGDQKEAEHSPGSGTAIDPDTQLPHLISRYEDRAGYYAGKIRDAVNDVVEDSGWEKFKDGVDDFLNNKWVKIFFEAAGWIAAIIGAVALFTPVGWLAGLALGITFLIAAKDALAVATGNGSWYDLGLDCFALATLGTGKVAASALKATRAATKVAAQGAASRAAMRGVLRASSSSLSRANSVLGRSGASPQLQAAAARLRDGVRGHALRAGRTAGSDEAARPMAEATKQETMRFGGETDVASHSKDIARMRAQYADDAVVQQASKHAHTLEGIHNKSWSAAMGVGAIPQVFGESQLFPNKPHSTTYEGWAEQFKQTQGSAY